MALFSKILIFYVIGVNISFVIIWFISHEKTHIRLLSAFLVGITWPMSLPVALLFSLLGAVVEWTAGYLETKRLSSKLDLRNDERSSRLTASFIKVKFISVGASPGRE